MAIAAPLPAAPVPHPDRPDRLVETRDGFSVEYSPGQEAWMEMGFEQLRTAASQAVPAPAAPANAPATPGSARDLHERRAGLLAALAQQVGLPAATDLQGRAFDTFLGYYDAMTEVMQTLAVEVPTMMKPRHLAIWQRDDLLQRLRSGATIEGMSYDAATNRGRYDFKLNAESREQQERFAAIDAAIKKQRLKHTFNYDQNSATASFTLGAKPAETPKKEEPAATRKPAATLPDMVIPIIYRDNPAEPDQKAFNDLEAISGAKVRELAAKVASYRDATTVNIIFHETAEIGLLGNIITSPDRRWLCDGTANYAAWRVARDQFGPESASQVYNLDAQLRQYAALQPKINLVRWSTTENEKEGEAETDLTRAHYAFATRVMFLLAQKHGEDALGQLWADVAKTPKKKVSAKTFADAYRKRFKGDLNTLVKEAETMPIPPALAAATAGAKTK